MTLHFNKYLQESINKIQLTSYQEIKVHGTNQQEIIESYGNAKWSIVDLLNKKYSHLLTNKIDLFNWLNRNQNDEVAYFLNEAGSNSLNYSEHKQPHKFHLWMGDKGFIIGIEQEGKGFNPLLINENRIKENEGAAFNFFRECQGKVFFDDEIEAKIVYFKKLF